MKIVNTTLILSIFLGSVSLFGQTAQPNFELWNKHTEPLYYSISNSTSEAQGKRLQELVRQMD